MSEGEETGTKLPEEPETPRKRFWNYQMRLGPVLLGIVIGIGIFTFGKISVDAQEARATQITEARAEAWKAGFDEASRFFTWKPGDRPGKRQIADFSHLADVTATARTRGAP